MKKVIIIYATTDGHTREISSRLKAIIEHNNKVEIIPIEDVSKLDLTAFDILVVGASIRYGRHSPKVYEFIDQNLAVLDNKPNAFFTVNVVARKPEKNRPDTNPYLNKFLAQIAWKPRKLAVFAGKIDYQKYKVWDRLMIRMIMWITKGPTDPKTIIEFTDWREVEAFGKEISEM
jgi:menaquinone-dependent protoporphyrinogen oxidase